MEPYAWPGFVGPVPVRPGLAQWEPESAPDSHGTSVADLFAGQHLAQGILAALIKRASCGEGSYVHVSMLESVMDMQFEVFTTYLNDGGQSPELLQSITQMAISMRLTAYTRPLTATLPLPWYPCLCWGNL